MLDEAHERSLNTDILFALVKQAVSAIAEHGVVDIAQHNPACGANNGRQLAGQIAGAASKVHHHVAWPGGCHLDRKLFHQPVAAQGHQVIHHVIAIGHRVEYAGNLGRFLGYGYLLAAKVGGLVSLEVCNRWVS